MTRTLQRCLVACAVAAISASSGILAAQDGQAPPETDVGAWRIGEAEQLTGDWWGARGAMAERGVTFEPFLVLDFSKNTRGGLDTEGSAFRHLLSLNMSLDLDALVGLGGGSAFVDFQQHDGQLGSDEVGDWQWVGSWDAESLTQVSEVWYQQVLADEALRLKIGKIDANCEFAYTSLGWQFVHGSAGYPATSPLMPTYPDPATAACAFLTPAEGWSIGLGVFDGAAQEGFGTGGRGPSTFFGAPADLYLIGEVGYAWPGAEGARPGRVALGAWHHTGTFERWDGGTEDGASGFYAVAEQVLWAEGEPDPQTAIEEVEGVAAYLQYDHADEELLELARHLGAGVTWRGAIPGRDADVVGLGLSAVEFSGEPEAGFTENVETAIELFYRWQLIPSSSIQPYAQYIADPGGVGLDDALNLGVRVEIAF